MNLARKSPRAEEDTTDKRPSSVRRLRFGLRDLLLLIAVVGMASAVLASIVRKPLILDWLGMLGTATCLVIMIVLAACVALVRRGWIASGVALALAIIGSAALHTWLLPDWAGMEAIISLRGAWFPMFKCFLFAFSLFAAVVLCVTCCLAVAGVFDERTIPRTSVATVARIALLLVLIGAYGPLAVVYYRMLAEMPVPEYTLPDTNAYPQIMAAVEKLHSLNRAGATIADIRDVQGNPARSKVIAETYRELMETLKRPAYVPMDMERDAREEYFKHQIDVCFAMLRPLARTWDSESSDAAAAKQYDVAADFGLANMRLGGTQQTGGILYQFLTGVAVEEVGIDQINGVRHDVSHEETRQLIETLEAIDRDREPLEVTIARDVAWSDRAYTWRNSLGREAPIVLALTEPIEHGFSWSNSGILQVCQSAKDRRDAMQRLLMVDLALRLFRHDEGRLPESLAELCPKYLSTVPLDPYSGRPLVYRRVDDTCVLYSVWDDGDDDGGKFGTFTEIWGKDDFDLDLDVHIRPPAPPPAPTSKKQ